VLVKICGLRTVEHALAAAAAGADMLGFVFAPSRRQVTPEQAATIAAAVRDRHGSRPQLVGLFVNTEPSTINRVAALVGLDHVQLSGDEPVAHAELITHPIIKAVRLDGSATEAGWLTSDHAGCSREGRGEGLPSPQNPIPHNQVGGSLAAGLPPLVLLVDAHVPGSYGGTGVVADWERAAELAARVPLILAGGLTPVNVAAAIAAVAPIGVDVSSGVETDGIKDCLKIEAFIGAARATQ
jgi:phosphoribosylanthranilate isomerase